MQRPYRVLQVVTIMNRGGAETMIMNHYRAINRDEIQFDFLVHREAEGAYDKEIITLGGKIFKAFPIRPWNYVAYFKFLDKFFSTHHEYIAIHSHIQDNCGFAFKYAQKYGINNCIANSHIAPIKKDYKYLFRLIGKLYTNKYTTKRLACGTEAGKYMFGKRKFDLFNNAIDLDNFKFNSTIRDIKRKELNLSDKFIIGNVARFNTQKNHVFLIDIFNEVSKKCSNAHLLLVGNGDLKANIEKKVHDLGLENKVSFLGVRSDVSQILQAMDVFLFPSLYEGLPVSVIEAQATGIKCVLSDTIDNEVDVTNNVAFLSLDNTAEEWCDKILTFQHYNRIDTSNLVRDAGYDIKKNVKLLMSIYKNE